MKSNQDGDKGNYNYYGAVDNTVSKMFFNDVYKAIVLLAIVFKTNYAESYEGLERMQSYFSYSFIENNFPIKRSKLQKIMKELEKEGFIEWFYKAKNKNEVSIISLNYQYGKGYGKQYSKKYSGDIENKEIANNYYTVKNTVDNTENNTLSIYSSIYKSNNNNNNKVIEIDINIINKFKYFFDRQANQYEIENLNNYQKEYPREIIIKALEIASKRNVKNLAYVEKVLKDWKDKKLLSVDDIEYELNNKKLNVKKLYKNNICDDIDPKSFNNFKPREYDYEDLEKKLLGWDNEESEGNYTSNNSKRLSGVKLSKNRINQIKEHERLLLKKSSELICEN